MDPRAPIDFWHAIQDRMAAGFGITPSQREATVTALCGRRTETDRAGYWLQLLVATGIASLGLALDSTAVVIGGMLVSPLMGPIVELGMGLGIGSALLVLRALWRTVVSIAVVVGLAVSLTGVMPFQEVTSEIAARTSPTVLDLALASFCALAAAYTTMRAGSDTASAAAGTAIAIALVPPLCVVGYGLGAANLPVAGGAALLFTANLSAILVFAMLSFIALGYARVPLERIESEALQGAGRPGVAKQLAKALRPAFHSRFGFFARLLMPALLVAAVFFPLRRALAEVAWQIEARQAIDAALAALPSTVRTSTSVVGRTVALRLVVVGDADTAARVKGELEARITGALDTTPVVEVSAVPDLQALQRAAESLRQPAPSPAAPPPPPQPPPAAPRLRSVVWSGLSELWPAEAGRLLEAHLTLSADERFVVVVLHEGEPLGLAGTSLLATLLSERLSAEVTVVDQPLPVAPLVELDVEQGERWLEAALPTLDAVGRIPALRSCAWLPPAESARVVAGVLRATLAARAGRLALVTGERYELRVGAESPCAEVPAWEGPAEPPDAGTGGGDAGQGPESTPAPSATLPEPPPPVAPPSASETAAAPTAAPAPVEPED